ncbi:MAG: hypothetical protein V3V08_01665 [Nannocystaceae bacterium]
MSTDTDHNTHTNNDAIILSVDSLKFSWRLGRTMKAYLIGIAADNLGTLQITESLTSTRIKHRPILGRPFSWPLGHDGFVLYQRTGGLPDVVRYSLVIVRDRFTARKVGSILKKIAADQEFKQIVRTATTLAAGAAGANVALGLLAPAMGVVGRVLREMNDKVLDTIDGGLHLDRADKLQSEFSDTVRSAIADVELDFHLFDAAVDEDSAAFLHGSLVGLQESGLLIGTEA